VTARKRNPWGRGDFNEAVARLQKAGMKLPPAFETISEILDILESIEAEDQRRTAAKEAARKFRKQIS
jgi:hypothetical protein